MHAELDANLEKDTEECEQMCRLTDEQVVQQDVREHQDQAGGWGGPPAEVTSQTLTDEAHEAVLVELSAQGKQHGEPDERREHVAFLGDVCERDYFGAEQRAKAKECDGRGVHAEGRG